MIILPKNVLALLFELSKQPTHTNYNLLNHEHLFYIANIIKGNVFC